jgi:tetratricopeptide (TPR) repeat protein
LSLAVTALILITNLSVVRADIYFKVGLALREAEQYDDSIALYRRALALSPHQDRYYLFMALDSMAKMEVASDAEQRAYWFEESKVALEKAQEISPLDPDHPANLGTLYLRWAGMASDPAERAKGLERALEYYQQATAMSPHHHGFRLQGDVLQIHLLLGDLYTSLGELDQAVAVYEKAREVDPDDYGSHRGLATVYQLLGRFDEALNEAKKARRLAPPEEKGQIDELIAQLKAQMP